MKDLEFNIEKSTLRHLTTHEVNQVAGGTGATVVVVTGVVRVIITTIGISTTITTTTGHEDQE